ncbi:1,6-anhydro-N-acetylmuramyl-L-alanine amidase AmpD [uncultured Oxalicibacterium sp.]|uniref:1,6-anhydro-N-acetylmuramyl-L-alanine amidase AmpD n=1 Tax=uncultured Oxalicibacterium sp. TaxID=1168540 RepID=UPI0025CD3879|nr:1,6-anhydro-N-acetylmuramyl-L-alanine amidase AmpD [uncultured Oxalicibacterium sp.]
MNFPAIAIDTTGWADNVLRMPSPNFDQRAEGMPIGLLVVHNISLPPGEFGGPYIADLFLNRLDYDAHSYFDQLRALRVSAHFLIRRDGQIIQFVSAFDRAWHAGASVFCGRERCNDFSIGIELEGTDFEPFEDAQYAALTALTIALQEVCPLQDVTGHEQIAPGRKTDPGPFFDWQNYRKLYRLAFDGKAGKAGKMRDDLRFYGD